MSNDDGTFSAVGMICIIVVVLSGMTDDPLLPITVLLVVLFLWLCTCLCTFIDKACRRCQGRRETRQILATSDHNPQEQIHAPGGVVVEERSSHFDRHHNNYRLRSMELDQAIPSGIIIKSNDGNQIWADFEKYRKTEEDLVVLNNDHCVICLLDWQTGDRIRCPKNCSHIFHSGCLLSWMKGSNRCPSCRTCIVPLGHTIDTGPLVVEGEQDTRPVTGDLHNNMEEVRATSQNTSFSRFLHLDQRRALLEGLLDTGGGGEDTGPAREDLYNNMEEARLISQNTLFPRFLRMDQRRELLEGLLDTGNVERVTSDGMTMEVLFALRSSSPRIKTLPATACGMCGSGWSPDGSLVQSENPSCCHHFHRECILDHLLHQGSFCPDCGNDFVRADGVYRV